MSLATTIGNVRERMVMSWMARSEKDRTVLTMLGVAIALTLVYLTLIAPAVAGQAALQKQLPELRMKASQVQALAAEASALASNHPPPPVPMTRESLTASLAGRTLSAQSINVTGEYAKLQMNDVSFPSLVNWLDAQRREGRIGVQELVVSSLPAAGQVNATLTLRQSGIEQR